VLEATLVVDVSGMDVSTCAAEGVVESASSGSTKMADVVGARVVEVRSTDVVSGPSGESESATSTVAGTRAAATSVLG